MVQHSYSNNTTHMVRGPTREKYSSAPCTVIQELCFNFYHLLKLHNTQVQQLSKTFRNLTPTPSFHPAAWKLMLSGSVSIIQQQLLKGLQKWGWGFRYFIQRLELTGLKEAKTWDAYEDIQKDFMRQIAAWQIDQWNLTQANVKGNIWNQQFWPCI